mgnify:CR=1 FL=1
MPPAKNVKKSAPKNKKVVKTAPKPSPEPVKEPEKVSPPVSVDPPVVNNTPYLEDFSSLVSDLDNAMNTIRDLKSRIQKLEKQLFSNF